ncbi:MAG TPA: MerR family transcriptional regulator [Candidatus Angelobacter sp.]|nr:MerR family transcriptional regulator [Candidatus Angelobacter sp.]
MLKVSEFAEKAGLTVRTLHHYDRLGLLKPSERNRSGYRLYGERDLVRLQQIATLKFIGLSLKQIKNVLDGNDLDLPATLSLQRRLLTDKRGQIELALRAIEEAERSMGPNHAPDWAALKKIIEVMEMETNKDWMKRYYSDEAQARISARARAWTPEMQARAQQDWKELIAEVDAAIQRSENPAGGSARGLAERWSALVRGFTGGDPEIQQGVNKLYSDQNNWPATFQKPFSDEVWNFIRQAMKAHGISCV